MQIASWLQLVGSIGCLAVCLLRSRWLLGSAMLAMAILATLKILQFPEVSGRAVDVIAFIFLALVVVDLIRQQRLKHIVN